MLRLASGPDARQFLLKRQTCETICFKGDFFYSKRPNLSDHTSGFDLSPVEKKTFLFHIMQMAEKEMLYKPFIHGLF
jgi:hypothetical protein